MKSWSIGAIILTVFIVFLGLLGMLMNYYSAIMPEFDSIPDLIEYPIIGFYLVTSCVLVVLVCAIIFFLLTLIFYIIPVCIGDEVVNYYRKFNSIKKEKQNKNIWNQQVS
jgi:hypothetical protein